MRQTTPRRARSPIIACALLAMLFCLPAFATPAPASSSPSPAAEWPPATQAASPAADPALTATAVAADAVVSPSPSPSVPNSVITCVLSASSVVFGDAVTATGTVKPETEGQKVVVVIGGVEAGSGLTDASGAYAVTFTPHRSGDVLAVLSEDATVTTEPQALAVKPRASISHGALVPFLPSQVVVRVTPLAYDGVVVTRVVHRGVTVGAYRARAQNGKALFRIPLRGVDAFTLRVALPEASGLAARSLQTKVSVRPKTLAAGSSGPYVKAMLAGLQQLRFRIPGLGSTFTSQVKDSVMAFQKAYRLSRTYVFNTACWRKLDGAKLIKPRFSSPATHIEVDKGRQILMVVRSGKPAGIICVSTGATDNTPEGSFRIRQKHPFTTSGYGGILVRTMGFVGDFAIHGYAPVPPYPASHGCIREPIWACYWVYDNSAVGEALYVYR